LTERGEESKRVKKRNREWQFVNQILLGRGGKARIEVLRAGKNKNKLLPRSQQNSFPGSKLRGQKVRSICFVREVEKGEGGSDQMDLYFKLGKVSGNTALV